MRCLFGLICVVALGALLAVGCSETGGTGGGGGSSGMGGTGGDGGAGGVAPCEGIDCDDEEECTVDSCNPADLTCNNTPVFDGKPCDFKGGYGLCSGGVCVEDLCGGDPCNDNDQCTYDTCDRTDGSCTNVPSEDYVYCDFDGGGGNGGSPGYCLGGVCIEDLCFGNPCDDDNPCTFDSCFPEDGSCSNTNRADGTWCMDDLGQCMQGVCVELPVCGAGRTIPEVATTDEGRLSCEVSVVGSSYGTLLKMAVTPSSEIQPGENTFALQVEFGIDAETVDDALARNVRVIHVESIMATIDATMGDNDPTPVAVGEDPVPCTMALEAGTPATFVSPAVDATWTLDVGPTLKLSLQDFEELLVVLGGLDLRLTTVGPAANCVWETEPPSVSFSTL